MIVFKLHKMDKDIVHALTTPSDINIFQQSMKESNVFGIQKW